MELGTVDLRSILWAVFILVYSVHSIPDMEKDFSLLQSFQTGSGAHSASYSMGNGDPFPAINAAEA